MTEHRTLLMRANRLLGSALVEHNLVSFADLEAANERVLALATEGRLRQASVLGVLVYERKALREEELLRVAQEELGLGLVDLRHYDVPEEIRKDLDLDRCWATWTVPYDRDDNVWFLATAYSLSPAVREHWEKRLAGPIIWSATSMDIISEFLDRQQVEQASAARSGANPTA